MEIRLLGPVELWGSEREIPLGTPRQRCVFAVLAVFAGQPVEMDQIAAWVWGERLPGDVRKVVYTYVSRLRRALEQASGGSGKGVLRRAGRGYQLDIDPDLVDLHQSRRLAAEARVAKAGSDERAVDLLDLAASKWRGVPLAGLDGHWVERTREGLAQERLAILTEGFAARLRLGGHADVTGPLADLLAEHPLDESLAGLLMRALYRCGRPADALQVYAGIRQRLVDEIGDEPGVRLRRLHEQILRRDPALDADANPPADDLPATASGWQRHEPVRPAQLPAAPTGFVGRTDALKALDELLAPPDSPVAIALVVGAAGVGKTTLAIHWAHRVADQFPDGQLYVNLRGFDPGGRVMDPTEAIRRILDALGVPPQRVPADLDGLAGLYRSLLAGRRMLVVLDNARDADQLRPLLPGARGCMVVVTSRHQLTGLIATEAARPITVDLLSQAEAYQLLARRVGADRLAAEPRATEEIIARCARLPLALAIVAARAATYPNFALDALAEELRETHASLDAFASGDTAVDIRAVFSWSYNTLSVPAGQLFRQLGIHPGPDIATPAAASLHGITPTLVRPLLAELTRAHLLTEHSPGRFAFHDLLRSYAAELACTMDSQPQQRAARFRMLDHYLHTAYAGDRLLNPHRDPPTLRPAVPGVTPEKFADHRVTLAWFNDEYPVLLAATKVAVRSGFDTHAWELAWTFVHFLDRSGFWHDLVDTRRAALEAAERLADRPMRAHAHRDLGRAYVRLERHDDAQTQLRLALDLYREAGDTPGQARTYLWLGGLLDAKGDGPAALAHVKRALDLYRNAGHRAGEASSLSNVGWLYARLGDHHQALTYSRQGLALHQELGNRAGQAETWDSLGYAHHHLGHRHEAIVCYRHALDLHREIGYRYYEADTLVHLADTHLAAGDPGTARDAMQHALTILDELDHPDADQVRARLRNL